MKEYKHDAVLGHRVVCGRRGTTVAQMIRLLGSLISVRDGSMNHVLSEGE